MAEPPELWVFVGINVAVLAIGTTLTGLSVAAYRRAGRAPLRVAALGFGLVTVGNAVEAVYELGIRGSYELGGRELLLLHSVESAFVGLGLAAVFYSLRRY